MLKYAALQEKWEVRYINHKGNIIADRVYNTVVSRGFLRLLLPFIYCQQPDKAEAESVAQSAKPGCITLVEAGQITDSGLMCSSNCNHCVAHLLGLSLRNATAIGTIRICAMRPSSTSALTSKVYSDAVADRK